MSLYKRGAVWWVRFTAPDGRELRETAETTDRRQAQEYHDARKAECWRQAKLGERPRYTWQQAVVRFIEEGASSPSTRRVYTGVLRLVDPQLGGLYLDQIDRACLDRLLRWRQADGSSPRTVNLTLTIVRAVLNRAVKAWGWLDYAPPMRRVAEPQRRIRWLTRDEADRLLAELPPHLQGPARLALATGLREQNVLRLEWNQVDLERRVAWIHADQAKSGKVLHIPLNADVVVVLRERMGNDARWVFGRFGRPITHATGKAWYSAIQRAGIPGVRWHDLRHTWASWHVQAGTPLLVLKELGGWAKLEMVMRYAHLGASHLAEHAERIAGPRLIRTNSDTAPQKAAATG